MGPHSKSDSARRVIESQIQISARWSSRPASSTNWTRSREERAGRAPTNVISRGFIGETSAMANAVSGGFVSLDGSDFYRIESYDQLPPFFMTIVSSSDHWLFVSSAGGLTAGRVNAEHQLFPYETVDKIHESSAHSAPITVFRVHGKAGARLWQPFDLGSLEIGARAKPLQAGAGHLAGVRGGPRRARPALPGEPGHQRPVRHRASMHGQQHRRCAGGPRGDRRRAQRSAARRVAGAAAGDELAGRRLQDERGRAPSSAWPRSRSARRSPIGPSRSSRCGARRSGAAACPACATRSIPRT